MKGTRLEGYYTVQEIADKLGIKRQRVLIYIQEERLAPVKHFGNNYLIPIATFERFERSKTDQRKK